MIKINRFCFLTFALIFFFGFGNGHANSPIQDIEGVPAWVGKKGQAFSKDKKFYYGVGLASGVNHATLKRRVAEVQARNDLAATLQSHLEDTIAMTIEESTDGKISESSTSTTLRTKQVVKTTLRKAEIVEYWEHPEKNDAYALARIPRKDFVETIKKTLAGE